MEQNNDTITVYWSTPNFLPKNESWSMLYQEPVPLLSELRDERSPHLANRSSVFLCPAMTDLFTNLFVVRQSMENSVSFTKKDLSEIEEQTRLGDGIPLSTDSKLNMWGIRTSSFNDHVNLQVNQGWIFYSETPLTAEFTAPYYPPTSPSEGARLSPGKFDVGQWFRPFQLDYHIPINTQILEFKENDPLFYVKFLTTKKVILKRFIFSAELENLQSEHVKAPLIHGAYWPLKKRYELAKKVKMKEQILHYITKNCVE